MTANSKVTEKAPRAALYFDGACPICKREIALVRRLTRQVDFIDVHGLPDRDLPPNTNRAGLLLDLHFQHPDGQMDRGLEANVALWQATPLGWLWRLLELPLVRPMAQRFYRRWADRRYQRMGYCAQGSELTKPDGEAAKRTD